MPIEITASTPMAAATIKAHIQTLANNLDSESLAILAEKSKKPGIGEKLKSFKNMI